MRETSSVRPKPESKWGGSEEILFRPLSASHRGNVARRRYPATSMFRTQRILIRGLFAHLRNVAELLRSARSSELWIALDASLWQEASRHHGDVYKCHPGQHANELSIPGNRVRRRKIIRPVSVRNATGRRIPYPRHHTSFRDDGPVRRPEAAWRLRVLPRHHLQSVELAWDDQRQSTEERSRFP